MNKKIAITAIAMVAIALLALQFGSTGFFALPADEHKTLDVGVSLALSGSAAADNEKILKGIELARDEINAGGGIGGRKIRLVVEDDKCDAQEGASIINKFANTTGVPVIIGGSCSSVTFAMAPIARENNIVLISPYSSNPQLVNEGIFRTISNDVLEAGRMADFAFSELKMRKVAFLYVNNDYGKGLADEFRKDFEGFGGSIVAEERFETNEKDFKTQLLKLNESEAEAIYLVAYPGEFVPLFKQKKELGIEKQILTITIIEQPEIIEQVGNAAEGTIFTTVFTNPGSEFGEKFSATYGGKASFWNALGFDTMNAVAKAIQAGGYNALGIRKALQEMDFQGAANRIKFDEYGDPQYKVQVKRVKDGKFVRYE